MYDSDTNFQVHKFNPRMVIIAANILRAANKPATFQEKVSVRQNHATVGFALSSAKRAGGAHAQDDHAAGLPKRVYRHTPCLVVQNVTSTLI